MLFISKFSKVLCAVSLILCLSVLAFADTIRLKDGRIIKGKIVSFDGGKFTVMFDDGTRQRQVAYSADEVESIVFDSDSTPAATVKTSNQIPTDTANENNSNTIITVGQTNKTSNPQTSSPKANPTNPVPNANQNTSPIAPKPIAINVKVSADNTSNGWTNSGWVVRQGQRIKIVSSGRVSLGSGRSTTPGGIASLPDTAKLIKDKPTGGLIAVVGDDNNDFIYVGDSIEFVAARDGALFLGVNEGNLDDNSGAFDVKIEISPDIGN
ncbi:MAG: LecA/PA-IL family lectin [Pyrinomonadaceae bacterium]